MVCFVLSNGFPARRMKFIILEGSKLNTSSEVLNVRDIMLTYREHSNGDREWRMIYAGVDRTLAFFLSSFYLISLLMTSH